MTRYDILVTIVGDVAAKIMAGYVAIAVDSPLNPYGFGAIS